MSTTGFTPRQSPLLDAAHAQIRPLLSWSAAQRAALCSAIDAIAAQWSGDWSVDIASLDGGAQVAGTDAADSKWNALPGVLGIGWALQRASDLDRSTVPAQLVKPAPQPSTLLLKAIFGNVGEGGASSSAGAQASRQTMAQDVAQAAWDDWCARLGTAFGVPDGAPDFFGDFDDPWSGVVVVRMAWCGETLLLAFDGACMSRWIEREGMRAARQPPSMPGEKLAPLREALASSTVAVAIELSPIDVDLGALASLRVGDVLRTTHALESPLTVRRVTGPISSDRTRIEADKALPLCEAFLGRQGHRLAIELVRMPPASYQPQTTSP